MNLLFGVWKIIGLENEMIGVSEVLGANKNSPIDDGEIIKDIVKGYDFLNNLYLLLLFASYSFLLTFSFCLSETTGTKSSLLSAATVIIIKSIISSIVSNAIDTGSISP